MTKARGRPSLKGPEAGLWTQATMCPKAIAGFDDEGAWATKWLPARLRQWLLRADEVFLLGGLPLMTEGLPEAAGVFGCLVAGGECAGGL